MSRGPGRLVTDGGLQSARLLNPAKQFARRRQVVALVDFPVQEFAKLRAVRDAENRASREMAELICADLSAALAKR